MVPSLRARGGSSPRVRGTVHQTAGGNNGIRFIPACAGNSPSLATISASTAVHPRVCGEQPLFRPDGERMVGSSPRVRGTGNCSTRSPAGRRFIPACAGNRSHAALTTSATSVHPRVCGEQETLLFPVVRKAGSSPRVRGTGTGSWITPPPERFIPACAGNRIPTPSAGMSVPVHPRVCGEQVSRCAMTQDAPGSSPRVRGTAARAGQMTRHSRFIPACAGNSRPPSPR